METLFAQRFVLEGEIGAGGMARVYRATDEVLARTVALKILNPGYDGTDMGNRFRREGRTAANLSHPHVVTVYGAGEAHFEEREASYIVMEYVPGGDLKALVDREEPLKDARLARIGAEVASGLAHAHEKGVIHRDIKPHNVLIDGAGRAKLTDFGIARALDATQGATRTGAYLGTALYSAPEQLRGEKVTPKSDVYSLGVTLYQAAVGELPFVGAPIEVATQHINNEPPPLTDRGASLSGATEALILRCMQKEADHRPTAEEVHEILLDTSVAASVSRPGRARTASIPAGLPAPARTRSYAAEAPTVKPPNDVPRGGGRSRRGPAILASAALLLALLGAAAYASSALLTGGAAETALIPAQAPQEEGGQEASPEDTEGGGEESATGGGEDAGATDAGATDTGEDPAVQAPEETVREFYNAAADEDYGRSWGLMTPGWRQNLFSSQDRFSNTFSTLKSIEFVEGPAATVYGDTATVSGVTIARHTDRTERNRGTWTLVYENGEWRISGWQVDNISTGPA